MIALVTFVLLAQPVADRTNAFDEHIRSAISDVNHVYPVPFALVKAIIHRESYFNPKARSRAGAIGLMQVTPFNAPRLGMSEMDLWDPQKNILAGTRLLAVLLRH